MPASTVGEVYSQRVGVLVAARSKPGFPELLRWKLIFHGKIRWKFRQLFGKTR